MIIPEQLPAHHLIAAVIPCYGSNGDSTIIITTEGTCITTRMSIRTIIRRLAARQATDLAALKKCIAGVTEQTILHPLPLTPRLVLFPVKTRKPRAAGDTSTGYINLYAVTGISKNKGSGTTINLSGNTKVSTLWRISTVKKHMQFARLAVSQTTASVTDTLRENGICYVAGLAPIAQKLAEIIHEIILFKTASPLSPVHPDAIKRTPQP